MASLYPDLTGRTFGRLTPWKLLKKRNRQGRRYWRCRCECGGWKNATTADLRHSRTRSCGCLLGDTRRGRPHVSYPDKPANCQAESCDRGVFEKGLFCQMHSRRVDRHGSPDVVVSTEERLARSGRGFDALRCEMLEAA
jgi:hypothetical protein